MGEGVSENLQNQDYSCLDIYVFICVTHDMCDVNTHMNFFFFFTLQKYAKEEIF